MDSFDSLNHNDVTANDIVYSNRNNISSDFQILSNS